MKPNDLLNDYSSKIKKLYIEIHNYAFFHGPSEINQPDDRFIGRKKLLRKLSTILSDSETKSGAYLITGYRGVGKSSYVSKAIEEVASEPRPLKIFLRYLRLFFLAILIGLLNWIFYDNIYEWYVIPLSIVSIIIIYWNRYLFNEKRRGFDLEDKKEKTLKKILMHFDQLIFLPLIITSENKPRQKHNVFIKDILILLIILLLTVVFYSPNANYISSIRISVEIYYGFVVLNISHNLFSAGYLLFYKNEFNAKLKRKKEKAENTKIYLLRIVRNLFFTKFIYIIYSVIKYVISTFYNKLILYINYSKKIFVKINLGYDDLKELDILRLIALNMKKKFKESSNSFRKNIIWKVTKIIVIYILAGIICYSKPFNNTKNKIKYLLSIEKIFPSQSDIILKDPINRLIIDSICDKKTAPIDCIYYDNNTKIISYLSDYSAISFIQRIDVLINNLYCEFCKIINEGIFLNTSLNIPISQTYLNGFYFIPPHLDYFFLFYFLIIWISSKFISELKLFGVANTRHIKRKLKKINDLIDAQITVDNGINANVSSAKTILGYNFTKKKQYPIADERVIENHLIEILDDISQESWLITKPEFVIIFDEIDKIEPRIKEETGKEIKNFYYTPEQSRIRQQSILSLLSNLKFFITSAKVKFIFIAGKEMYDAALADISDRNFLVGSFFHDVIDVNSFFSESLNEGKADITRMTENYVCSYLFPDKYKYTYGDNVNLKDYNKYLVENFDDFNEDTKTRDFEKIIARQKREKVIFTLRQFITFLAHSSNGAPKKLTEFFEDFIINYKYDEIREKQHIFIRYFRRSKFFLKFDYYDQHEIGMINYLVHPIMLSLSSALNVYSDKLLVSASFIIDHLFKFYHSSFSWRNLELSPEIIDINKTPELRLFINEIMRFLTQTHIIEIDCGLFDFKYKKRITQEMSYLSKISERSAAAFNFTLDESLAMKHHFRSLLKQIKESTPSNSKQNPNADYMHSISFIHMILGDLSYYDDEFNEAIVEYMEAIQYLRYIDSSKISVSNMILLIRNMLKLGLTFEKRRNYDTAFLTYGELTKLLIGYRNIDLDELGLSGRKDRGTNETDNRFKTQYLVKKDEKYDNHLYHKEIEPKLHNEYIENTFSTANDFLKNLSLELTPKIQEILFKISSFEGIRLINLPILAKLQIIEKSNIGGITDIDIYRSVKEFEFLTKTLDIKQKYLMTCEFFCKMGDILFYKNSVKVSELFKRVTDTIKGIDSFKNFEYDHVCTTGQKNCQLYLINRPCKACYFYNLSLEILLNGFCSNYDSYKSKKGKNQNVRQLRIILLTFMYKKYTTKQAYSYKIFAKLLSNKGDSLLSCLRINKNDKVKLLQKEFLSDYFDSLENISNNYSKLGKILKNKTGHNTLEIILICYLLSSHLYKKAGEHRGSALMLTKILYFIKEYVSINKIDSGEFKELLQEKAEYSNVSKIESTLIKRALKGIYKSYDDIHSNEINKIKDIFTIEEKGKQTFPYSKISLNKVFINADIEEIIITYQDFKLKCFDSDINDKSSYKEYIELLIDTYKNNFISPYNISDHIYNRILKLLFKSKLNYRILKCVGLTKHKEKNKEENDYYFTFLFDLNDFLYTEKNGEHYKILFDEEKGIFPAMGKIDTAIKKEMVKFLITDSIFCLNEVIKLSNIYGKSFMLNHTDIGTTHKKLMDWCIYYNLYLSHNVIIDDSIKEVKSNEISKVLKELSVNFLTESEKNTDLKSIKDRINKKEKEIFDNSNNYCDNSIRISNDNDNLTLSLKDLIDEDNFHYISGNYQCEKAIKEYYRAFETHTEGKAYKQFTENMYFLNDDFDDRLYHLAIALERFRINSGYVKDENTRLKQMYKYSSLFKHENYLRTQYEKKDIITN